MSSKYHPGLLLAFVAGAAVSINRIVKLSADGKVVHSTAAAADAHIGVTNRPAESGDRVDVAVTGVVAVECGAAVTRGAQLQSDATGKASPAAAGDRVVGIAMRTGAAGDIVPVLLAQGAV
ncbi:MAG: DUF2190 family protein [Gammaproteobacteria bacterium]|nr:DUF2190 family protein [Gammaproteobacteria bacterium]